MVYFIGQDETNFVKIGYSVDPKARLSRLQAANPNKLHMLGIVEGGYSDERMYHKRYAEYCMHGEWFRLPNKVFTKIGLPLPHRANPQITVGPIPKHIPIVNDNSRAALIRIMVGSSECHRIVKIRA